MIVTCAKQKRGKNQPDGKAGRLHSFHQFPHRLRQPLRRRVIYRCMQKASPRRINDRCTELAHFLSTTGIDKSASIRTALTSIFFPAPDPGMQDQTCSPVNPSGSYWPVTTIRNTDRYSFESIVTRCFQSCDDALREASAIYRCLFACPPNNFPTNMSACEVSIKCDDGSHAAADTSLVGTTAINSR